VELLPAADGQPGLAALWVAGQEPVVVGELASGAFFLETSLDMTAINAALVSHPDLASLELTTGYHDRASLVYEEFFYLGLGLRDLPTLETLYSPAVQPTN
jgi:glycerophosphoryl diester phosphodiesterase